MTLLSTIRFSIAVALACAAVASAGDKDKPKPSGAQLVDSGAFGVFVRGQRVVTESFSVQQQNGVSTVKSQLKEAAGAGPTNQKSELLMTSGAELIRYEWSDSGGSSLVVMPNNEFLLEKITTPASNKPAEQPFMMPNTSAILDNNFFVHREVLAWRYLATNCHTEKGSLQCQQGPLEFGVLVPQDRTSLRVRLELVGREKVTINGTDRQLLRLNLSGENFNWALWVEESSPFKLMRVLIADDHIEIVRD